MTHGPLHLPAQGRIWKGPDFAFDLDARARVMGIVNMTGDSFSGDGLAADPGLAVERALQMAAAGADVLDVGGESTRPGASAIDAREEIRRVVPVVRGICEQTGVPVSIDTTKASVARAALDAGASIVNDISGLRFDPGMVNVCAKSGAACVVMHIRGTPRTMQQAPHYDDLVGEVKSYLSASVALLREHGVESGRIAVDPGIGFGKTFDHNLILVRELEAFRALGCALLVGPSRKAFIGHVLGGAAPDERLEGTAAVAAAAVVNGADIVRVHDVEAMVKVVRMASAIRNGSVEGLSDGD